MAFLKQKSSTTTLVSAKLPEAAKVEYIEYSIDGGTNPNYVNINSPFILDDSDDGVCYSYENNFGNPAKDKIFNNSEYNPAIKEFNVFLPSSEVDSIENITVHLAGGDTIELTKVADSNPVRFEK